MDILKMRTILALTILFFITACQSPPKELAIQSQNIVILGGISIPSPYKSNTLYLEAGPSIIAKGEVSISYGIIDNEKIKFLGSNKSPYNFISDSFEKRDQENEIIFFNLFSKYNIEKIIKNNLTFYKLTGNNDAHLYILSRDIDFVVDIYMKSKNEDFIDMIIQNSKTLHGV
jgi:hypothetical protein